MNTFIDQYKTQAIQNSRLRRLTNQPPEVHSTREFATGVEQRSYDDPLIINTSIANKVLLGFFIAFFLAAWTINLRALLPPHPFTAPLLIPLAMLTLFIVYSTYTGFISKKYHTPLTISREGITGWQVSTIWDEIAETALEVISGKKTSYILLIFTKNGETQKIDLAFFNISPRQFSAMIEYYKSAAQTGK